MGHATLGRYIPAVLRTVRPSAALVIPLGVAALAIGTLVVGASVAAATGTETTATEAGPGLSVGAAVILGLVEGLTEYLPVSSTGHLLVTNEILGLGGTADADRALDAYAICIQAGAILAVLVLYQARIRQMVDGLIGRSEDGRTVLISVIAAFVPTAIIGLLLRDVVRDRLFGPTPIAFAWLVGGIAILLLVRAGVFERAGAELNRITIRQSVLIGLGQAIALWPGVSRSLVTIIVAVLVGLSIAAAVEFSFLLGLVTLTAATALTALDDGALLLDEFGVVTPAIGLVVAFVAAVASVKWMVSWLQSRGPGVFGWYRIAIGIALFGAIAAGWI